MDPVDAMSDLSAGDRSSGVGSPVYVAPPIGGCAMCGGRRPLDADGFLLAHAVLCDGLVLPCEGSGSVPLTDRVAVSR